MSRIRPLLAAGIAAVVLSFASVPASAERAPSAKAMELAKEHFGKGKALYDAGNKKASVEEFKEAYRLSKNPLLLYNIGLVYDELSDRGLAVHYYEKFLSDAATDDRARDNRKLAEERARVLRKQIEEPAPDAAEPTPRPAPVQEAAPVVEARPAPAPSRRGVTTFTHDLLEEGPPGQPLDVTVRIPEGSDWTVTTFYRRPGQDDFVPLRMKSRYDELVGRIPAEVTGKGGSVQYYVEAKDREGTIVGRSGKPSSPNIVYLEKGATPHFYKDLGEGLASGGGSAVSATGDDDETPDVLGGSSSSDDEPSSDGDEGSSGERPSSTLRYAKWGATGSAAVFVTASVFFYVSAGRHASVLEDEAADSNGEDCTGGPPCTQWDDYERDVQKSGQFYDKWTKISLIAGAATAGVAATLWYLDYRAGHKPASDESSEEASVTKKRRQATRLVVAPMLPVGDGGVVGGTALVQF